MNCVMRRYPMPSGIIARLTLGTSIMSRMSFTSKTTLSPRRMVRVTSVFGSPRMRWAISSLDSSAQLSPFTAMMRSPAVMPARKAGVPSMEEMTSPPTLSSLVKVRPTPPNCPVVVSSQYSMSSAVR